jgi:hypothetical protein
MKRKIVWMALGLMVGAVCFGQPNMEVKKVHVIFKTHLDIGYTDLLTKVRQQYIDEFIPKAIAVGEQLAAENSKDRYIWTTGSWLIATYLSEASPEAVKKLEAAIQRGDIVWNGVPYTYESEAANKELYENGLKLALKLDKKYGKKTIAAKMTDVPGHTRGVVSLLSDAGIQFLNIGVNEASQVPQVPAICRWKNTDGKEIILMYLNSYGGETLLPDGKTAVSIQHTNDNHGPHTVQQVRQIYAKLREKYPNAEVFASNLNEVAAAVTPFKNDLPLVTSEIGDTWIYGYASSPLMMARYRELMRLYADWLQSGKLDRDSDIAVDFAVRLGMVAEHTWGASSSYIKHWDKYDVDIFRASRDIPGWRFAEKTWQEKAALVDEAIAVLPDALKKEALEAVRNIGNVKPITLPDNTNGVGTNAAKTFSSGGMSLTAGNIAYQTFSCADFDAFYNAYQRDNHGWAYEQFRKFGLEKSSAKSAVIEAVVLRQRSSKTGTETILDFPDDSRIDKRVLPEQVSTNYTVSKDGKRIDLTVSLFNKPANRLPEAYWVSFVPAQVSAIVAEKLGCRVDVLDVVKGGNRQMHGIDRYVDLVTEKGTIRITSLDAPLVVIGERNALNYSLDLPDLKKGIHFCLFNNLWNTNFCFWWEGSLSYRFKIEMIKK